MRRQREQEECNSSLYGLCDLINDVFPKILCCLKQIELHSLRSTSKFLHYQTHHFGRSCSRTYPWVINYCLMEEAIERNSISLLQWIQNQGFPFIKSQICQLAARLGSLEVLKWERANEGHWDESVCADAARGGHLDVLKWARENGCPWNETTCSAAAAGGHLEVLKWARENGCPWDEGTPYKAAKHGNLEILKWLDINKCPWSDIVSGIAAENGHLEIVRWLKAKGYPELFDDFHFD